MTPASRALTILFDAAEEKQPEAGLALAGDHRLSGRVSRGDGWAALAIPEGADDEVADAFRHMAGVTRVRFTSAPYPLVSLEATGTHRSFNIRRELPHGGSLRLGCASAMVTLVGAGIDPGSEMPGPRRAAHMTRRSGGAVWHAGTHGTWGTATRSGADLDASRQAARESGVALSIGVADRKGLEEAQARADLIQIEGRDMQNFDLLRALGRLTVPVVLRRGPGATIEEFLLAAEYVLAGGNGRVALCEAVAGGRPSWGPRLEINAVLLLKRLTHLPVIADLSGCSQYSSAIAATACAAIAAGADGVLLPVVDESSATGGRLTVAQCREAHADLARLAVAVGREISPPLPEDESTDSETRRISRTKNTMAQEDPALTAVDVLHRIDGTLADTIHSVIGMRPRLDVIRQERITPPYPRWLRWLLKPEGALLVRWTSYKLDGLTVTRNLSYVDFARVDATVLRRLQAEEVNLGELFASTEVDKFGFAFGTGSDAGPVDLALREGHGGEAFHPYVWRRYIASTSGRVGFLVVEALPTLTWQRLLAPVAAGRTGRGKG